MFSDTNDFPFFHTVFREVNEAVNVIPEHGSLEQKLEEVGTSILTSILKCNGLIVTSTFYLISFYEQNINGALTNNIDKSAVEKAPVTLPLLVPSLKGKMTYEGGNVTCKGVWGMSDFAHTQPNQTSDFEFKLVKGDEDSAIFPVNGKYQGWFLLKQALPLKGSLKIEDKEMVFKFSRADGEEHYTINGSGVNKFGSFTLKGTLSEEGDLHVYREYFNLTPAPVHHHHGGAKRRLSIDGAAEEPKMKKKAAPAPLKTSEEGASAAASALLSVPPPPPLAPLLEVSPREGAGRIRKQSLVMKEYIDTATKPAPTPKSAVKVEKEVAFSSAAVSSSNSSSKPSKAAASSSSGAAAGSSSSGAAPGLYRQDSASDRAHRLSFAMKKCSELVKEVGKHPQCVWFLEPVDYLKLNIPDYPLIVTRPMDFGTIKKRIEGGYYPADSVEGFAEDVRLVFRNAITFNQSKDNVVHIAARAMSARFEDRFRVMTTQLAGVSAYSTAAILANEASAQQAERASASKKGSGSGNKTPRSSLGGGGAALGYGMTGASGSKQAKSSSSAAGPRVASAANLAGMSYLPPVAAVDGSSAHQLLEMQRMMQAMQNEISTLKSQVRENEIVKRLTETK